MNRFVEWLSDNWIGGVIGGVLGLIGTTYFFSCALGGMCKIDLEGIYTVLTHMTIVTFFIFTIGFLLGAFIYSLVRRIK